MRTEAESEPASGSVSANEVTISPEAMPGSHFCFLRLGAEHDEALAADADIGAERRAERRRAAAELEHRPALFLHGEAEPAVLFRDRKAEQAERLHLRQRIGGDGVVFGDLGFERDQPLVDEAAQRGEQLFDVRCLASADLTLAKIVRRCGAQGTARVSVSRNVNAPCGSFLA